MCVGNPLFTSAVDHNLDSAASHLLILFVCRFITEITVHNEIKFLNEQLLFVHKISVEWKHILFSKAA